jgi:hypothetical protein
MIPEIVGSKPVAGKTVQPGPVLPIEFHVYKVIVCHA